MRTPEMKTHRLCDVTVSQVSWTKFSSTTEVGQFAIHIGTTETRWTEVCGAVLSWNDPNYQQCSEEVYSAPVRTKIVWCWVHLGQLKYLTILFTIVISNNKMSPVIVDKLKKSYLQNAGSPLCTFLLSKRHIMCDWTKSMWIWEAYTGKVLPQTDVWPTEEFI